MVQSPWPPVLQQKDWRSRFLVAITHGTESLCLNEGTLAEESERRRKSREYFEEYFWELLKAPAPVTEEELLADPVFWEDFLADPD